MKIHTAHGYLLSQFLSPLYNRRDDAYGGPIEHGSRIHREIVTAVRKEVGSGFPIFCKINGRNYMEGGLTVEDSLESAQVMATASLDAVEVSGGLPIRRRPQCLSDTLCFSSAQDEMGIYCVTRREGGLKTV